MIRTLHHMADPDLALSQTHRVMQPEGIFILEFANKRNLKSILRYVVGRQEWNPFSQEQVEFVHLNFDFHPKAIQRSLRACGFEVEKQLTVSHFRMGFLKRHIPQAILVKLDSLLQWTGAWVQVSPSVFSRCRVLGGQKAARDQIFQCPQCQTPLTGVDSDLHCAQCGSTYPYQDGIYDFRINKASG